MVADPTPDTLVDVLLPGRLLSFRPSDVDLLVAAVRHPVSRQHVLTGFRDALTGLAGGDEEGVYDAFCLGALLRSVWLKIPDGAGRVGALERQAVDPAIWFAFLSGFTGVAFQAMDETARALSSASASGTAATGFPTSVSIKALLQGRDAGTRH